MPKTTPKTEAEPRKDFTGKDAPRFVKCDLTPDQKVALTDWATTVEDMDLLKWIESRVVSGHVLSIRSNDVGYQASLTGMREASGHIGLSLVARASTPIKAVQSCWYKDELVLEGKWTAASITADLDF